MPPITTFPAPPEPGNVYHTDCFTLLDALEPESVNAIITDMPYGVTNCAWDTVIDLPRWWQSVKRVLKPRGVMVTTASQPFTSALVMSNPAWFKYEWIWVKHNSTGFSHSANAPLKNHENICIFSPGSIGHAHLTDNRMNYYPQGITRCMKPNRRKSKGFSGTMERTSQSNRYMTEYTGYPRTVLNFNGAANTEHPTQKPVPLYEYLTLTYTAPGDLIVDPFCGSGTSLLAARNLNRRFIGGDITEPYVELARRRLAQPFTPPLPGFAG